MSRAYNIVERFEDVTIGIDNVVGATHTRFLLNRCEFDAPHPGPLPAGGERESWYRGPGKAVAGFA